MRHTYAEQYTAGRGPLTTGPEDPPGLSIDPLVVGVPLEKYSPVARLRFERAYGAALVALLAKEAPDVVITANVPLLVERAMMRYTRRSGLPWILWHQDIVSLAVGDEAARRLPRAVVPWVRRGVESIERRALRQASAVVAIGDGFVAQYGRWELELARLAVVPNWAPLDEIRPCLRHNTWAEEHGLRPEAVRLIYAGTLGRKHNPALLIDLLRNLRAAGTDAELTVVSEGEGADLVRALAAGDHTVRVLPFQPAGRLSDVLASADILVALLEPGASLFSIPSKVLSYLAAGRPVLGLMPPDNPSAADIEEAGGLVAAPSPGGVVAATAWIRDLAAHEPALAERGRRSRALAERRFDVQRSADTFVELADAVVRRSGPDARRRR